MEMQMEFIRKLPSPQELMQDYPLAGADAGLSPWRGSVSR